MQTTLEAGIREQPAHGGSWFPTLAPEKGARMGHPAFRGLKAPAPSITCGNPDFVLPSVKHYKENPLDSIIFTAKRSLRERWRQITSEGEKGTAFFLATIDENVTEKDLRTMQTKKIFLVVPARLKTEIERYAMAPAVLTFEDFFLNYLDPAMARWRRSGTIG
jgi:hypothetical protein